MNALLERLVANLATQLKAQNLKLATAESCTGGAIAAALTALPGASDWFVAGLVTYSNQAKQDLLGVPAELIAQYGAVSQQTVEAMALGALVKTGADVSVAVTGVAGPGGGTPAKPVGTVWLAVARGGKVIISTLAQFPGNRAEIRQAIVIRVLETFCSQQIL